MTSKDIDDDPTRALSSDTIGYGRPPKASQFRKGQSGNPKGRPKKKPLAAEDDSDASNEAIMRRVLEEPVKVREGGEIKSLSKAEVLQRKIVQKALSGESINLMRDLKTELKAEDARQRQMIEEDHALWARYIKAYHMACAAARSSGKPVKDFWILPEDIAFPAGKPVRLRGPRMDSEVEDHETLQKLAKAWLALQIYGICTIRTPTPEQDLMLTHTLSGVYALHVSVLSTRKAAECEAYRSHLEDISLRGKHHVAAELHAAWQALGCGKPPTYLLHAPSRKLQSLGRKLAKTVKVKDWFWPAGV